MQGNAILGKKSQVQTDNGLKIFDLLDLTSLGDACRVRPYHYFNH